MTGARNPAYCGTCGVFVTGLWSHENRCKSHKQKLAIILANINLLRPRVCAASIQLPDDKPTPSK